MSKRGPIIIIENDLDDQHLLGKALKEIGLQNKLVYCRNGKEGFNYLMSTEEKPFLILSDVSMEVEDGIELRRNVNANDHLRMKSIPFIYMTNSSNPDMVNEAYRQMVQGYFVKPDEFERLKALLHLIVEYWSTCRHPNNQND